MVAAAGRAGCAEPCAVNPGPGEQVIDGPAVVVDLEAEQGLPGGPQCAADQGAVVAAFGHVRVPFAGAERVDGQDEEAELGETEAPRLHDRIAPRPGPVAVNHED